MTLEEYLEQKRIEESKYDFIDRDFIDYFNLEWQLNHFQIYEELLNESKIIYDKRIEQENINKDVFIRNPYIKQITNILKNKKYHSIDEAIKNLIKSEEYQRYKKLKEFVINILNNKEQQAKYIESYKKITNTSLDDDKIINQLEYNFNKFWSSLQKGIYQYIEENHIIKESILSFSTKKFIINDV
jgi:hypothetical protein